MRRLAICFLSLVVLFSLCSCGKNKYWDMKNYLNSNSDVNVVRVEEWIYNETDQIVTLNVVLAEDSDPSLEELDSLRNALDDYMKRPGGYLDQKWQISVIVDEAQFFSSTEPHRYSVISNYMEGYNGERGTEPVIFDCSDTLNTFWFCIDSDDVSYISSLNDVENIYIAGQYSIQSTELLEDTLNEIKKLDNIKTLAVCRNWYDTFASADLDCELYFTGETASIYYESNFCYPVSYETYLAYYAESWENNPNEE